MNNLTASQKSPVPDERERSTRQYPWARDPRMVAGTGMTRDGEGALNRLKGHKSHR